MTGTWDLSVIDPGPAQAGIPAGDGAYHLNATQAVLNACGAAAPYVVAPASPTTIWAGAPTVFLKFPDEATAKAILAAWWRDQSVVA
jgi:hypothetical protein